MSDILRTVTAESASLEELLAMPVTGATTPIAPVISDEDYPEFGETSWMLTVHPRYMEPRSFRRFSDIGR
jgi:hypothetical protein